jgi:hydrogenase 3 maturation protease
LKADTLPEHDGWKPLLSHAISTGSEVDLVGVGNPLRGDDGVGLAIVAKLRRRLGARSGNLRIHEPSSMPERLLSRLALEGRRVVLFDAVEAASPGGQIVCSKLSETKYGYFATHNVPLKLIPGLESRPEEIYIVGVQPESMEVGEGLSPAATKAAESIVDFVADSRRRA